MATISPAQSLSTPGVATTGHGTTAQSSSSPSTHQLLKHQPGPNDRSNITPSSTSFEMSEIDRARQQQQQQEISGATPSNDSTSIPPVVSPVETSSKAQNTSQSGVVTEQSSSVAPLSTAEQSTATTTKPETSDQPPQISRLDSVAIGEATDVSPIVASSEAAPTLIITLLLTTGARHPYKIDEKYLTKRNVTVPGLTEDGKKDPLSVSVYTLKELILREWREEWETAPSSPSSIRLIFFGRLLDDSAQLKDCRFNTETANVVHMTVRPQDIVDDEEAAKGKSGSGTRTDGEDTAGCRCVIL